MDIIHRGGLTFEIDDWRPCVTQEMHDWFVDNDISYETEDETYGPGDCHYFCYIWFHKKSDAVAFKLRWS